MAARKGSGTQQRYPMMDGAKWQDPYDLMPRVDEMFAANLHPNPKVLRAILQVLFEEGKTAEGKAFFDKTQEQLLEQLKRQLGAAAAGDIRQRTARIHPIVEALIDGLLVHSHPLQAVELACAEDVKPLLERHLPLSSGGVGQFGDIATKPEVHGRVAVCSHYELAAGVPFASMVKHYDGIVIPFTSIRHATRGDADANQARMTYERVRHMLALKSPRNHSNNAVRVLPFIHQLSALGCLPHAPGKPKEKADKVVPASRFTILEGLQRGESTDGPGAAVHVPKKGSRQWTPGVVANHSPAGALYLQEHNPHGEFHVCSKDPTVLHHAKICRIVAVNFPTELPVKAPLKRGEGTPGEPQSEPHTRGADHRAPGAGRMVDGEYGKKMAKPTHEDPCVRLQVDNHPDRMSIQVRTRDVCVFPNIFNHPGDENFYENLLKELKAAPVDQDNLMQRWHFDSHFIADDSIRWKKECPTFIEVVNRMRKYFGITVTKTRFNWYKDTTDWKPLHHDAAAIKADKAALENFTLCATFGATREIIFEEVQSKRVISLSLDNGFVYSFSRDVNAMWKHGVKQEHTFRDEGRISVVIWGWIDMSEAE